MHVELERVHTYFEKLKKAAGIEDRMFLSNPDIPQRVDTEAAGRMISAASGAKRKHKRFNDDDLKEAPNNEKETQSVADTSGNHAKPKKATKVSKNKTSDITKTKPSNNSKASKSNSGSEKKRKIVNK